LFHEHAVNIGADTNWTELKSVLTEEAAVEVGSNVDDVTQIGFRSALIVLPPVSSAVLK
jgi:hypothetical protein